jgi:hypothetical protein
MAGAAETIKVFCFFSSEKKGFLEFVVAGQLIGMDSRKR